MSEVRKLLDKCNLTGQWSIDIMQNGDDFWLIDMARATESALVECVPKSKLKNVRKPFLTKIPHKSPTSKVVGVYAAERKKNRIRNEKAKGL